jgi:hypothetical protein
MATSSSRCGGWRARIRRGDAAPAPDFYSGCCMLLFQLMDVGRGDERAFDPGVRVGLRKKALRRSSGVSSLGGAGLFPSDAMSQARMCLGTAKRVQIVSTRIFIKCAGPERTLRPFSVPIESELAQKGYPARDSGGCRDRVCGDGAPPGRTGSGIRAGSDSRPRLKSRAGRSVRCS